MCLQARLPNGVVVDLRECELPQVTEVLEALVRVRCSVSTKP
jgi:transposase